MLEQQNHTGVRECKTCGKEFKRTGAKQVNCPDCRKAGTLKVGAWREKQEEAKRNIHSGPEIKDREAEEIFADVRKLHHPRAIDVSVRLAKLASRANGITFNAHLCTHGLQNTLLALKGEEMKPPPEDIWHPGSRLRLHEQYALWDYGMSWRVQPDSVLQSLDDESLLGSDGRRISFEGFRSLRRLCIVAGAEEFGRRILGKDFHAEPHGRWADEVFIKLNPDLLPEKYSWEDVKKALAAQSNIRQRLLISSRSSYKSSYVVVDLLSWVLAFGGDLRIQCCSATKPLSKGFLKSFRDYWTYRVGEPALFSQLWPEFSLFPDELGSQTNFISPMRRLDLIQATYTPVSLDSEGLAGERTDFAVYEDVAEINNSSTPEQREKTLTKVDMLNELVEPFGQILYVGTPISSGTGVGDDPGDIYSTLLAREDQRSEKRLLYRIDPCWTVKEGVNKLPYDKTLTEDEVILLFPSRLTFSILMGKLSDNEKVFRQQNLCSWVPDGNEGPKIHFSEEVLRRALIPLNAVPQSGGAIFSVIVGDLALTSNRTSDNSALACVTFAPTTTGKWRMFLKDAECGRYTMAELAHLTAKFMKRHPEARSVYIERISGTELLQREVYQWGLRLAVNTKNIYWASPDSSKDAQQNRLLGLSILLENEDSDGPLLRIANGHFVDELVSQFLRVSATRPNAQGDIRFRRIDLCDALAISTRYLPSAPPDPQRQEDLERQQMEANRRAMHDAMFGSAALDLQRANEAVKQERQQAERKVDPRLKWGGLPPAFRM